MKSLRLLLFLIFPNLIIAQQNSAIKPDQSELKKIVQAYLDENKTSWNLTDKDISDWSISSTYSNEKSGITYVYVNQQINDLRIFNAVSSVSIKEGKVTSFAKRLYPDAANKINANQPSNTAIIAIQKTASHLGIKYTKEPDLVLTDKNLNRTFYKSSELSNERIRVELVYQSVKKSLRLAWDVNIRLKDESHWWNVRIDAVNGEVLQKNDWTVRCDYDAPQNPSSTSTPGIIPAVQQNQSSSMLGSYRVFPLPLESPGFGPSALLPDPSNITASPYGWHDTNGAAGAEYTITRGNNVYAYDDIASQNAPGTSPNGTATLTFDFPTNFSQQPATYLDASLTNLFYINNMMHDILYLYGFNEEAGNFQQNNYGNGGFGQDYVEAECQDGGGSNNANFSTPDDGNNGRMQMYLWSGSVQSVIVVNSPAPIAGNYNAIPAGFGPAIVSPITADLVLVDDGTGVVTDACEPLLNAAALVGKIAVLDRGSCDFVEKVLLAQNAGAIAVIVINNAPGLLAMGDNGNGAMVTIPSEMITLSDGTIFKNTIAGGGTINATLNPPPSASIQIDGSLDNGIVIHEFGHGVSNRLTGGPLNSNCLSNAEQGGEGWSDYFALLFTIHPGDSGAASRGVGTFALGQPTNGYGIRRFPYSTNMSINPQTYSFLSQSGEVHDIGEIWCTALWEMSWALINQYGFNPDWVTGTSGNNIALKLVIEGMKLQPCNPGFVDARDAILLADDNVYGGIHKCLIWEAFAKRGLGYGASQGDPDNTGDETESFNLPPICLIPTSAPTADFDADVTTTCFGTIHFNDLSFNTPQGWAWDFGDNTASTQQNPVHTYTAPGIYSVKLVVTNTLGIDSLIRSSYITITSPAAPVISGDSIICSNDSTSFTAALTGGNVAEWKDSGNNTLFVGPVFNTPPLSASTTYFVTQYIPTVIQNAGPPNNNFGTGGYHTSSFEGKLNFTTLAPMRLKSIWTDANGTALRTINLYTSGGTIIQSINVNILNGQSRVVLNLDIPALGNYQIGVSSGSNLYRNNSGASYPYSVNGLVNITSSNSTSNPSTFYYYLYDWEVQELPCTSSPLPVNVIVDQGPLSSFLNSPVGLTVQFTNTSGGNPVSSHWDFGNGDTSAQQNPLYTYTVAGTYTVTLTVLNSNGCESVSSQTLTVTPVGISDVENESAKIYYNNNELIIKFKSTHSKTLIRVYDPIGKLLVNDYFSDGKTYSKQLHNLSSSFIMVHLDTDEESISKKIVVTH